LFFFFNLSLPVSAILPLSTLNPRRGLHLSFRPTRRNLFIHPTLGSLTLLGCFVVWTLRSLLSGVFSSFVKRDLIFTHFLSKVLNYVTSLKPLRLLIVFFFVGWHPTYPHLFTFFNSPDFSFFFRGRLRYFLFRGKRRRSLKKKLQKRF
jgi:hypothetical protein